MKRYKHCLFILITVIGMMFCAINAIAEEWPDYEGFKYSTDTSFKIKIEKDNFTANVGETVTINFTLFIDNPEYLNPDEIGGSYADYVPKDSRSIILFKSISDYSWDNSFSATGSIEYSCIKSGTATLQVYYLRFNGGTYYDKHTVTIHVIDPSKDKNTTTTTAKKANTMTVKTKMIKVSAKTLKNKNVSLAAKKAFTVKRAKGRVIYKKTAGSKKISVSKAGKITVMRGLKKGKYPIKVKVTAAGNKTYKAKSKTVKLTITVK